MKNQSDISRRQFIGSSATLVAGIAVSGPIFGSPSIIRNLNKPYSEIKGVKIGVITYSFRGKPDQSAEATLKYITDCGISQIELMGDPAESFAGMPQPTFDRRAMFMAMRPPREGEELTEDQKKERAEMREQVNAYNKVVAEWRASVSMDKFEQMKKMYKDAGVSIYAFKPSTFGRNNTEAEIDYGLRAAKTLGATHVTLELPGDDNQTAKLAQMAAKHKMYVAYHGHEQQTPTIWDTALGQSEWNAMNLDFGHYVAAGNANPLDIVKTKHDRIRSMHVKDRQTPEHGKGNLPFGQGDTPIIQVLQLMRDQKYKFPATIELEYSIPEGSDEIAEIHKCFEYCKKALES